MKLLLDQNVSFRVVKLLEEVYPNSVHIKQVNLENASDIDIRRYAIANNFIIVTFDDDLISIMKFLVLLHCLYGFGKGT